MKNVLLLVHDDAGQEARYQTALDLTRAFGGHLTCIDVSVFPVLAADYSGVASATLFADECARESKNKADHEARLAHEDVSWDWIDARGSLVDAVVKAATLADLIVLNRQVDSFSFPDMEDVAGRILTQARKPIVAVPDDLKRFELGRALVAWDGRASSAATMRACVPLLVLASQVEIFTVGNDADRTDPTEAAEYLSRHGIHASVRTVEAGGRKPDQLIVEESARWHADYVVMGAYDHGRLMQTFGGVTKRLLTSSKLPLVLGH